MSDDQNPAEVTCEFLQKRIESAVYCDRAVIPGDEFRSVLKLAMRNKLFARCKLDHLEELRDQHKAKLTGHDLRVLLMLASKAHPKERRKKLRTV